jgi:4-aminobutyrate aminotransferase/(S)-3-amino-2-methylpropionate transaminase
MSKPGQSLPELRTQVPGPLSRRAAERLAQVESPSVDARRLLRARESGREMAPIVYASGEGANVVDLDGNRYVDMAAGFGALLLGHRPAAVSRAVAAQSERLWLALGDLFGSDAKAELCERVASLYPEPGARVMLGSSGADAVTAALKTAVLATGKPGVVAFEGAYHGLSHGPLAACGFKPSFRAPFAEQLNGHVSFAPYPADDAALGRTLEAVEAALRSDDVGCVLVEPVLGRGGCVEPPASLLPELRRLCDARGVLLVADEIWTGLGRAGAWLATVDRGVVPDVMCLGKGLGGGLPVSACVGSARAMAAWGAHGGTTIHTATHFGAPLACAAALATLDELRDRGLVERSRQVGDRWRARLRERTLGRGVASVRGQGMMVGVVLEGGAARTLDVSRGLLERGWIVVTGGAAGDVLTLTPALDIDEVLLDGFVEALAGVLS